MMRLAIRFDKADAGKRVARWKKRMDAATRRAVRASHRAIHMSNGSGPSHKAGRLALKAKRELLKAAKAL